jgi:hypothetical protein
MEWTGRVWEGAIRAEGPGAASLCRAGESQARQGRSLDGTVPDRTRGERSKTEGGRGGEPSGGQIGHGLAEGSLDWTGLDGTRGKDASQRAGGEPRPGWTARLGMGVTRPDKSRRDWTRWDWTRWDWTGVDTTGPGEPGKSKGEGAASLGGSVLAVPVRDVSGGSRAAGDRGGESRHSGLGLEVLGLGDPG